VGVEKQTYVHACIHTHMYTYVHTPVHTYINANIHTHTFWKKNLVKQVRAHSRYLQSAVRIPGFKKWRKFYRFISRKLLAWFGMWGGNISWHFYHKIFIKGPCTVVSILKNCIIVLPVKFLVVVCCLVEPHDTLPCVLISYRYRNAYILQHQAIDV